MNITAAMVKQLREQTGIGMMECKKALEAAEGDLDKAIENLRKAGKAKAAKKSGRIATEGRIVLACKEQTGCLLEINCETDFASKENEFIKFCQQVGEVALDRSINDLEALKGCYIDQQTVLEVQEALVAKIGENIQIRRLTKVEGGAVFGYLHANRIGVLVVLDQPNPELGKDLAMHIAATKSTVIYRKDVSSELLEKEKEIYLAQMADSGKPENIKEKIITGKLNKFLDEISLEGQPFVKAPDCKVGELLNKAGVKVLKMVRFELGEGITKENVDFAKEVEAQIAEAKRN